MMPLTIAVYWNMQQATKKSISPTGFYHKWKAAESEPVYQQLKSDRKKIRGFIQRPAVGKPLS
jgi:hypothetical protein